MDLLSTRTPMPLTQPTEEKQQPVGARLLDNYVRNADHYEAEDVTPEFLAKHTYAKEGAASGLDFDSWSKQNGVTDFLANAQTTVAKNREQAAWDAAQPETRGFLAGTGAALGRGAMNVVGSMGHTLALADATPNAIDTDKGILDRAGEGMTKWAEDKKAKTQFMRPTMEEEKGETGAVKKAWEGGVESMVTSTAPMAAGFAGMKAGGALGAPLGPAGIAVGGTIGGLAAYGLARFGMFGAGVYGDTYDKTYAELKQKNPGMGEDEVRRIANKGAWTDAISENVSEAVGDAAAFYTFGGSKVLQQPLKATIKDVMKRGLKGYATDVAKQMPFEVGSEMANAAVGANWRQEAGLQGGDMAEAAKEAIGPAVVMSLLMGGGVAGYTEVKARKSLANINGADADVRARTANEIALQIKERTGEEDLAESWRQHAFERIGRGEEIELDEQLMKFGANRARIDAADAGQDIPVVTDETEQELVQAAEPVTPAESLLTGGVKQRPEDVLLGTDPIIPEPFNPAAQSPVIEQQRQAFDAAYAQDGLEEVPSAEEIAPVEAQAAEPQDLDAEWADREAAQQFDAEMRMRRAAIQAEAERARTRVKNLDSIPGKLNEKQMRNLDAERRKLMDAQAELDTMDRQGMTGMADEAEARGVEEFGPASVGDKQLATSAVVDKKAASNSDKADLPSAGTVTAPAQAEASLDHYPVRTKTDSSIEHVLGLKGVVNMGGAEGRTVYRVPAKLMTPARLSKLLTEDEAKRDRSDPRGTESYQIKYYGEITGDWTTAEAKDWAIIDRREQQAQRKKDIAASESSSRENNFSWFYGLPQHEQQRAKQEWTERMGQLGRAANDFLHRRSAFEEDVAAGRISPAQAEEVVDSAASHGFVHNDDVRVIKSRIAAISAPDSAGAKASKKEPWQMTRGNYYQSVRDNEGVGKSNARAMPNWSEIKKIVGFDFFAEGNEVKPLKKQRFSGGFSEEQEAAIKDALSVQGFAVDKIVVRNNEERDIPKGGGWRARSKDVLPTSPEHERAVRKALSEGKPVPVEVLAEYPDIAPQNAEQPNEIDLPAAQKMLADIDAQIREQGRVADARLLERRRNIERLAKELEAEQTAAQTEQAATATPDLSTLSSSELTSLKAGQRVRYLGQDGAYSVGTVDDVYKVGNDIHVDFDDDSKFVANGKGKQKDTGSAKENLTREDYADLFDEELAAAGVTAAEDVKPAKKPRPGPVKKQPVGNSDRPSAPKKTAAKKPRPGTETKAEQSSRERAAKAAKKMADGAAAALDIFSKYGGLSVREVKTGDEVNQDLYSEIKPHLMQVLEGAKELGHAGKDLAREVVRFLIAAFGDRAAKAKPYFMQFVDEEILSAPVKTTQQGAEHDQRRNAGDNAAPLEGELPGEDEETAEGLDNETGQGMRGADEVGDGRAEEDRAGRGDGVGGVDAPVLPDTAPGVRRGGLDSPLNPTDGRNKRQLSGENPGNFSIPEGFGLGEGSTGQKITANLEAIKTLKRIQAEHRFPTTEEQAVMARYVGWGGLANVFDSARAESTDMYGRAQRELRELLTDKEYSAAWSSTRNAHYTAPQVVEAMWQALEFFGFKGGRVLEPTVGVGNFLGMQPQHLAAATEWHASELDAITGQLAAMIYPEANVLAATGFQDAPFANGVFDAGIGNPPFGAEEIRDEKRPHLSGMKIHNYIIGKSGDHLRPGGVMAMVVTHRFLDTANPEARAYLAKHFRFVGAWRLPNDAFLKNAGTEVVTDVIFLQKLRADEKPDMKAAWLDVNGEVSGKDGRPVRVNRYYQENPQNILGESSMSGTMYRGGGQEYTVTSDGRDLRAAMSKVITESFANERKILQTTDSDRDLAPVMLEQSYLPIDGMILDEDGTIRRRDMDDIHGNAVVYEVTPETLWSDDADVWDVAVRNLRAVRDNGMSEPADEDALKKEVFSFAYNANGAEKPKPTKAEAAVYRMVKAMTSPQFAWKYDEELAEIERSLNRKKLGEDGYARLKGMLDLRNQTLALHAAEKQDHPSMEKLRRELRASYERFVKRFGFINDPKNLSLLGGGIGAEAGLEMSYDKGVSKDKSKSTGDPYREPSAKPADILLRRVNFPRKQITSAKSAPDSLHVSLTEKGRVDIGYMAKLLGSTQERVIAELQSGEHPLIFLDPDTNAYVDADEYLSGNVRHKLDLARAAGLPTNIRALEAAQPAPLSKERIFPNIRGMWMPKEIFEGFLKALGVTSPRVAIMHAAGKITADGNILQPSEFGQQFKDDDADILDLFRAAVDGKPVQVWRGSGDDRRRDNAAEIRVNALVERMAKVFPTWVYADEQRTSTVVDAFNQKMNTHVARKYDGEKYLVTVGANPSITLRRTQKNAAWRMMQSPAVLLDHVVGAGKTFTIITGIMERRRIGLSRKPMIVVPNHLVTQWAVDFYRLYPSARILAATPADFEKKNRRRLFARIASGDFDAVIVGHSSFGFIEAPADNIATMIGEKVDDLRMVLEEAKRNGSSKRTIKQMKARLDSYNDKLNALQARPHDAMGIDLHSMGVDYLAVDEAHEFKNLEYATSAERVVGMNDPVGSKKAFDLLVKLRGVRSRGGSVAFATGTPVSNSLVEIYSIMQYLAADDLKARNMSHFDAWSGAYVSTRTKLEYMPTQKLKARRVLAGLENLPSLRQLYESFADIITMSDLKRIYAEDVAAKNKKNGTTEREEFPIPKVDGGSRRMDNGEISPAQSEYMDYLVARADAIESNKGPDYARIDNMLWVMSDARKAALDIRLVDPRAQRDESGKVARAAANIKRIYDKWNDKRGAQLVFCDLSVPAANADKGAKKSLTEIATSVFGDTQGKALMKRMAGQPYADQWREMTARVEEMLDTPDLDDRTQNAAEKALEKLADIEGEVITADTKFSVYDDLRTMLRESGIPLNEIAFIHDYDSPEKKQELFARVRNGHVRVLIGSSSKMGAGMNAQDRLVALHHLDAPWRPSDMEQREGRIIRQGNVFYEEDPDNFAVEILAYSTKGTSDTVMWQILERKAAAIEQFRQGGLDTVTEESGDADQYAEFMANSTGNPVFRLKLEAERRMQELRAETGALLIAKQDAEVFLKDFAGQMARAERDVKALDEVRLEGEAKELTTAADALSMAKEEYRVLKAEYDERIEAATEAMAAWKELPKKDSGEKPAMPVLPKTPTVLSKELRDKSPYFAAVAKMIESSEGGQPQTMRVGNVTLELSAVPTSEGYFTWEAMLVLPHGNVRSLGATIAKRAEGSTTILDALRPSVLMSALENAKGEAERRVNRVKARKEIAERNARIDVDSAPLEQATAEAQWYARQVGFAEAEADARRAGKSNRYINMDRSRELNAAGNRSGVKEAPSTIKHGNETYALTGIGVLEKSNMAMQAVRWRDGVPAIVNMTREDADKPWTVASVDVEPGSVRGITSQFDSLRMYKVATTTPTPIDLREAFPWADSIAEQGGKTIITKGKVSFAVEQVESIKPDEMSFNLAYGRKPGEQDQIAGQYQGGTITLSKMADKWTVQHEFEHFLEDMGLITAFEQAVLNSAIKRAERNGTLGFDAAPNGKRMKDAELRAYYIQNALAKRDFDRKTTLGRVLQKIADFIDALVNLAIRTSRGVVRDVESGRAMVKTAGKRSKFMLPMLQSAYHGSPHRFSKFTLDAMGTGEGAQAYGWGLYFAGKKEVAEFYRKTLSKPTYKDAIFTYGGVPVNEFYTEGGKDGQALKTLAEVWKKRPGMTIGEALVVAEKKASFNYGKGYLTKEFGQLREKAYLISKIDKNGQLYKVEIPEDDVMLHWDRPLSEQPEKVREALARMHEAEHAAYWEKYSSMKDAYGAARLWDENTPLGKELYVRLEEFFGGDKEASLALNGYGIKGIKYLDGSSRGQGEGSYNYVIFDDSAIEILETYYQTAQAAGATAEELAEDPRIQYAIANMQQARELRDDILKRPEVFGLFKNINTQLHKAMRQPAFKRIFDRFHAAAGTQQRAAARSASLAPDILPDHSGGFKHSVRELLTKTSEFSAADLRHVSKVLSMETLAGKNPSPFAGHRLTDDELARIERGETVKVGDNDVRMNGKQVRLYRQTRAALDQMLREMGTSEAWRIIRGVLTTHQSTAGDFDAKDYWEVFANNPLEAADAMKGLLEREKVKADARLTRATQDLLMLTGADDMDGAKEWGKQLVTLNKAIDNVGKFSQKQLEDDDLDELVAKRERRIDRLAEELGISADEADATLKEYKGMVKEHTAATTHVENVKGATKSIGDVFAKTDQLIKAGYMPLSRFGQYRIDVRDEDGNLLHASFYDTSTEANQERRKLVRAFGQTGIVGEVETVSQEDWKLYQGQNPEALRLFAEAAGAESDEAIQAYYQDAISSRSALKRLINRQGYAGYSDDLQRILASFITSGSKRIGQNYHAADISDMVKDKNLPGDLRDEAIRLKSFIENPGDAGSSFRAFAANWYMLGSLMSAAWNGTQVVTSSLPELYKHSGSVGRSTKDIFGAYRSMIRKGADLTPTEKQALARAQEDGTVDAAEIHHLYAQATKRFINKLGSGEAAKKVGAFLRLWGMPFSWFETVNRKATFLAAYRMAERQGVDDPYALARSIVDISQGIYSKHNRPNVARSAVGGAVLTFMQYKIMTLEQIARNAKEGGQARKAAALQLAIIAAMGGWKALPGIEDITDLYDIIAQAIFGQAVLSKKSMREAIEKGSKDAAGLVLEKDAADAVGKFFADAVNSGIVTAALPVDVSTRAGMGSLVPGLKLLKPSVQYRDSIVFDMAGVPGSMIDSLIDASGMMLRGDMGGAAMRLAPNAVAAAAKGVDILATGEIKNTRGKKITDGDMVDGALQTIGAQPKAKSRINSRLYENQELKNLAQQEEKSIVGQWADAYDAKGIDARNSAIQAARQRIVDWNRRNPEWPIAIKQTQVLNELKNRKKTTVELATKTAPKELRPSMAVQ